MQLPRQIFSPFLIPISWLYDCVTFIRNQIYNWRLINIKYFDKPIISVGNITTGGSGKTPLVIYLTQLLIKSGKKPGIVSRGYRRKSHGMIVVHDGKKHLANVESAGDEPYLLARIFDNVPVVVCEDRSRGIRQLLDYDSINVIIMDDGFQHRKIKRDLDIVTVYANEKHENHRLMPWGNLRE